MHGLPAEFDPSVLVGRTLELVTFTPYLVHLGFDDEVSITVESRLTYVHGATGECDELVPPVLSSDLMRVTGKQVAHAAGTSDGALVLRFDSGDILTCHDDLEEYESYQIKLKDREIIV